MRYQGTDNAIMVKEPEHPSSTLPYADDFRSHYLREFGFELEGRDILVDDYRVRAIVPGSNPPLREKVPPKGKPIASTTTKTYFESGWEDVPVYKCEEIEPGHEIPGPSIIVQSISTIVVETDCIAVVTSDGDIDISLSVDTQNKGDSIPSGKDVPMDHCDEIRDCEMLSSNTAVRCAKNMLLPPSFSSYRRELDECHPALLSEWRRANCQISSSQYVRRLLDLGNTLLPFS